MSLRLFTTLLSALSVLSMQGCSESSSEDIRTSGFWPRITATSTTGSEIIVETEFRTGSGLTSDYINLVGNDYADAMIDGNSRLLSKDESIIGEISYETTFSGLGDTTAKSITVTLHRDNEPDYPNSLVMPNGFTIGAPNANESFDISNNDSISLSWSPALLTDDIHISHKVHCTDPPMVSYHTSGSTKLPTDSGTYSTTAQQLLAPLLNGDVPPNLNTLSCSVIWSVERRRSAGVHSSFKGGISKAIQKRSRTISLVP